VDSSLLTDAQRRLLGQERTLLSDLLAVLARLDAPADEAETLRRSVQQLDELFLLVVIGEFNAGKSAFVNALLGRTVLEEGVTPTTTRLGVLSYGDVVSRQPSGAGADRVTAPVDLLREIAIVDTPGTNAVQREHEALTRDFVPRSDLVLFVTSADRPFTESERAFLESVRDWGKKIVVAVNKIDILETEADRARVLEFVADNAQRLLGAKPRVFPVSARAALRAKSAGDAEALAGSGFAALEEYVTRTLDQKERVRLKLLNPLGVARQILDRQQERATLRREVLREDFETVNNLDGQLALYGEDLGRDFRFRLSDVEKELLEMERRGNDFFDETLRIGRIFDLLSHRKLKRAFEQQVVGELPRVVERQVEQVVEWMVDSDLRQWRSMAEHLERRRREHEDRIVGTLSSAFEHDRTRLLEDARRSAQRALASYDRDAESDRLADSVRVAVAGTAALQVGALGLGTIVTMVASTAAVDVTGILAAGALSAIGLLVLPARRSGAKSELREKVESMRTRLLAALVLQFEQERARSLQRLQEAIAPYTRFVRSERERLDAAEGELGRIRDGLGRIRAEAEAS
jgi:small GTP-binding protein